MQFHSLKLDPEKIEIHEAIALWLSLYRWRYFLRGTTVTAYMDNATVCGIANGQGEGRQNDTRTVVEAIKYLAEKEGIELSLIWIPRDQNRLADGLSKFVRNHATFSPRVMRLLEREREGKVKGVGEEMEEKLQRLSESHENETRGTSEKVVLPVTTNA